MAIDNRSVVITLKLDSSSGNEVDEKPTNTQGTSGKTDKGNAGKAIAIFAVTQAVEIAASEAVAWGEYYWNRDLMLHDDYVGQRNKQIAMTQINRGISAISTIGSMTAAGASVGGWVGAIVGAAIGTVTTVTGIIRSNVQGQDQETLALAQMDAQLSFTRARTGWSLKAASIGEDL